MKITKVEALPVSIPYLSPFRNAPGVTRTGDHVIMRIHTDDGIVGIGETSHIVVDRTGEPQESITLVLQRRLGPMLVGEDPFDIDRIMAKLEKAVNGKYAFPHCKAAIDCALWDVMGKALGVPVYKLLGGANRKKISVSRVLPIRSPEETAQAAVKMKDLGYRLLTIKIGTEPKADLARVAAVREAVGPDFEIEVDANQAFTADVAIVTLRKMEKYDIAACEQPCPWWDLRGMAKVKAATDIPIIADESVLNPVDALNVVEMKAADILCVKLPKCGGIYFCKKIAAIAEAAGLRVSIGSKHPFGVGTAALDHFVAATKEIEEPIGYGAPLERFEADIIRQPIQVVDGYVTVPEGPGLGVDLDEEMMARYANPVFKG